MAHVMAEEPELTGGEGHKRRGDDTPEDEVVEVDYRSSGKDKEKGGYCELGRVKAWLSLEETCVIETLLKLAVICICIARQKFRPISSVRRIASAS